MCCLMILLPLRGFAPFSVPQPNSMYSMFFSELNRINFSGAYFHASVRLLRVLRNAGCVRWGYSQALGKGISLENEAGGEEILGRQLALGISDLSQAPRQTSDNLWAMAHSSLSRVLDFETCSFAILASMLFPVQH